VGDLAQSDRHANINFFGGHKSDRLLEEGCRPIVEAFITKDGDKAIAVSSSYGDGAGRTYLDGPKAEWLWQYAAVNGPIVHIQPPMLSIGHEALMKYRQRKDRFRRREAIDRRSKRRGEHYRTNGVFHEDETAAACALLPRSDDRL